MAADDRFSRFKNIEKGRQEEASGKASAQSGRFGALEKQPEAAPAAPTPVVPERFTPAQPAGPVVPKTLEDVRRLAEAPSGLELAEVRPGDQPFVRCARCNIDNHALATTCTSCGANLNTPEQQSFNERLWNEHRAAQQQAAPPAGEASPPTSVAPGVPVALDPTQQRALAEALAREVAAKTKMQMGEFRSNDLWHHDETGFAAWFLNKLPPKVAIGLVVGALTLCAAMMAYKHTRLLGFVLSLAVGVTLFRLYLTRD